METIEAILFDFHGVLLFVKKGYPVDEMVEEIDRQIGEVTDDEIFKQEMQKRFGLNDQQFREVMEKIVEKYEAFLPLWQLLPELKKFYRLAIINNGTALTLPAFFSRCQVKDYFDIFVSSAIEGVRKPQAEIFLRTAERLGVNPQQCLFMDDKAENVEGARRVGMKTIWWQDRESGFQKFLEFLGQ